jgi:hypothetical protein
MTNLKCILLLIGLIITGCDSTTNSFAAREAELSALLDGDDAFGLDGLDDAGATSDYDEGLETDYGAKTLESYHPDSGYVFKFGRRLASTTRTITFTHGEDYSVADIVRTVTGIFISTIIDTGLNDTMTYEKNFTFDFQRKVRFVISSMNDSQRRWKVDALTLGIGKTGTKMGIQKLEYYTLDENGDWSSVFILDSELNLGEFISRDSLPMFDSWMDVKVELTVSNDGPEFNYESGERVSFHYGRSRLHKARKKMYDNGEGEDIIVNDNVFTKVWKIHGPGMGFDQRVYRGFFSLIDYGSLFDSEVSFHSAVWSLPYFVNRIQTLDS